MIAVAIKTALAAVSWTKMAMIVGAVFTVIAAYAVWHHKIYMRGWNGAIAAIAAQDASAIADAQRKRNAFKACREMDKRWDQTTGACK